MKRHHSWLVVLAVPALVLATMAPGKPKLSPDEVVQAHLKSLGSPEDLDKLRTCVWEGKVSTVIVNSGHPPSMGIAKLFSEGRKYRISLGFDFVDYKGEHFFSDGSKTEFGFSRTNSVGRSAFGDFMAPYDQILKDGLLGGTLSTAWALLDVPARQAKLDYDGLKKIGGKELHVLAYHPKKGLGADSHIQLFFEPDTFRHVRSFYSVSMTSGIRNSRGGSESEVHEDVEETFANFVTFEGITVPRQWTITYTQSGGQVPIQRWEVTVEKMAHNAPIDPADFAINQFTKK